LEALTQQRALEELRLKARAEQQRVAQEWERQEQEQRQKEEMEKAQREQRKKNEEQVSLLRVPFQQIPASIFQQKIYACNVSDMG